MIRVIRSLPLLPFNGSLLARGPDRRFVFLQSGMRVWWVLVCLLWLNSLASAQLVPPTTSELQLDELLRLIETSQGPTKVEYQLALLRRMMPPRRSATR